jgi:REP element-mobilizing transposase RayT
MLRKTPFTPGEIYHLYTRGVDKRSIFSDDYDKIRFQISLFIGNDKKNFNMFDTYHSHQSKKDIFKNDTRDSLIVDILAYCLMDNHVHLLVKEKAPNGISDFTRKIFTSHSKHFNEKMERTGALFESRFKSKHVDNDAYFRHLFSYIHLNPLKFLDPEWKEKTLDTQKIEEYTEFLESYPYSSYADYAGELRPERNILTMDATPEYFDLTADIQKMFKYMKN